MQLVKQSEVPATSNAAGSRRSFGWLETRRAGSSAGRNRNSPRSSFRHRRLVAESSTFVFVLDLTFDHDGLKLAAAKANSCPGLGSSSCPLVGRLLSRCLNAVSRG